jgi:pimeloyl-ACP methyl ester carboxylesterase
MDHEISVQSFISKDPVPWTLFHFSIGGSKNRKHVLMVPGFLDSCLIWNINDDWLERFLTEHYDVWILNNRGTHTFVSTPQNNEDWLFTLDDMARHDLPAVFEIMQEYTSRWVYVGYSQGCAQFLICMTLHPHLSQHIEAFVGLSPIVSIRHTKNIWLREASYLHLDRVLHRLFVSQKLNLAASSCCGTLYRWLLILIRSCFPRLFYQLTEIIGGPSSVWILHSIRESGGFSLSNLIWWIQQIRNISLSPCSPAGTSHSYEWSKIDSSIPMSFYRGTLDSIVSENDYEYLKCIMKQQLYCRFNDIPGCNHSNYLWANFFNNLLFDSIMQYLKTSTFF